MTKQNAAKYLPFVQALAEGKTVQCKVAGEWMDTNGNLFFDSPPSDYRVKSQITSFNVGDVFDSKLSMCRVLIVSTYNSNNPRYCLAGLNGLTTFSDAGKEGFDEKQTLDFLNKDDYTFVRNINDEIAKLIRQ